MSRGASKYSESEIILKVIQILNIILCVFYVTKLSPHLYFLIVADLGSRGMCHDRYSETVLHPLC